MFYRGMDARDIARQVAGLLNTYNGLARNRHAIDILNSQTNYVVETHGRLLVGAVGIRKLSFHMSEIKHLAVHKKWRRKNVGTFLLKRAIALVETPLVYATIREDNLPSIRIFESVGFSRVGGYNGTGHNVLIFTREIDRWKTDSQTTMPDWKSASYTEAD
jgi:N-acetylglutamate synthase-like GNAT family acetyltransferase